MTNKIEELASRAMGVVKAAKATLDGYDGMFRHLVREHGEVSALLLRLKLTSAPDKRRELWPTIRNELLAHEQAEMREVYPALRQDAQTRAMAQDHDRDAENLQDAIELLDATAIDSPQWQPNLERLIELVQEHVREEEEEQFPIADQVFKDRTHDLLHRFEKAKSEAMRQLNSAP